MARGAGEGSIYQRADGRWVGVFVVAHVHGKPRKRYVYARTRPAARDKLAVAMREHAAGQPVAASRQTLAQFAARYQRDVLAALAPNTRSNVDVALRRHILPVLGGTRLQALRPADVQAWLTATPGAARSRRQYLGVLHRVLAQAVQWGELLQNPADRVRAPQRQTVPARGLERADAKRLLAALAGDRWEALAWLALTVGPRRGELLALQWGDVDWERAQLTITRNYTRGEVRVPKSPASRRTVPLFPEVLDALRRRRAGWPSAPWVFTSSTGGLVSYDVLRLWWQRTQRAAGLVPLPFHATRHAAGSFLLDLGMPLPQVSRILGHSSVAVTASVYAHALIEGERAYVERLGALLGGE
jgi:integrase